MGTGTFLTASLGLLCLGNYFSVCCAPLYDIKALLCARKLLAKILERSDSQQLGKNTTTQKHN